MPVFLVKAASTSSSAFFIEAAANTVMDWSCACAACGNIANARMAANAAKIELVLGTTVLQSIAARQRCAPDNATFEVNTIALGEPSFQAHPARARRTACRSAIVAAGLG